MLVFPEIYHFSLNIITIVHIKTVHLVYIIITAVFILPFIQQIQREVMTNDAVKYSRVSGCFHLSRRGALFSFLIEKKLLFNWGCGGVV